MNSVYSLNFINFNILYYINEFSHGSSSIQCAALCHLPTYYYLSTYLPIYLSTYLTTLPHTVPRTVPSIKIKKTFYKSTKNPAKIMPQKFEGAKLTGLENYKI